jgi:hypothetical protein
LRHNTRRTNRRQRKPKRAPKLRRRRVGTRSEMGDSDVTA